MLLHSKGRFRCDMPSWRRVVRDSKTLSSLIKNSGYDPNIVVAICRGGLVPARLVCDFLHILVDDIRDTGDTLRVSLEHLKKFEPKEIRTAVLIHKIISNFLPDYYVKKMIKWRWVIFPWHVWEDLTGFIESIKATRHGVRSCFLNPSFSVINHPLFLPTPLPRHN